MNLPSFTVTLVGYDPINQTFYEKQVTLTDHIKGNGLILYFYPKDNTQGCTVQAVDFSQQKKQFAQKGYHIIGVSRDGVQSHKNFILKHGLTIELISDKNEQLCTYFDVIKPKTLYGKTHLGVVRSTFVFDRHQALQHSITNVKAKHHIDQLLHLL